MLWRTNTRALLLSVLPLGQVYSPVWGRLSRLLALLGMDALLATILAAARPGKSRLFNTARCCLLFAVSPLAVAARHSGAVAAFLGASRGQAAWSAACSLLAVALNADTLDSSDPSASQGGSRFGDWAPPVALFAGWLLVALAGVWSFRRATRRRTLESVPLSE
jgi:hypothetical protein